MSCDASLGELATVTGVSLKSRSAALVVNPTLAVCSHEPAASVAAQRRTGGGRREAGGAVRVRRRCELGTRASCASCRLQVASSTCKLNVCAVVQALPLRVPSSVSGAEHMAADQRARVHIDNMSLCWPCQASQRMQVVRTQYVPARTYGESRV